MKAIISISGGKDSTALLIYAIQTLGKSNIIPVFCDTKWESQLTYNYLNYLEHTLNIKIHKISSNKYNNLLDLIYQKKRFPHPKFRFCTFELKMIPLAQFIQENNLQHYELWLGIRKTESLPRMKKYQNISSQTTFNWLSLAHFKSSTYKSLAKNIQVRLPLINWTTNQILQFLKSNNINLNPLYFYGLNRVGCFPCLFSSIKDWKITFLIPEGKSNITKLLNLRNQLNSYIHNPKKDKQIIQTISPFLF